MDNDIKPSNRAGLEGFFFVLEMWLRNTDILTKYAEITYFLY